MRDSTGSETPQKKRLCVLGENTTDDDDSDAWEQGLVGFIDFDIYFDTYVLT